MASFHRYHVGNDLQTAVIEGTSDIVPGHFLENLKENLKIKIISLNEEEIVFDLFGVDVSIANALRRILLAEVIALLTIRLLFDVCFLYLMNNICLLCLLGTGSNDGYRERLDFDQFIDHPRRGACTSDWSNSNQGRP